MKVKKVLIKISGEALAEEGNPLSKAKILRICQDLKNLLDTGVKASLVIGGGNIIRGRSVNWFQREEVDSMGMLSTVINGIAFRACLFDLGVEALLLSPLSLPFAIENSNIHKIYEAQKQNKLIIFVGGAGQPYFSTDTISIISAIATRSDIVLKASKPDGIYDKDPDKFSDAVKIPHLNHQEAMDKHLQIMDQSAFQMAFEHQIPIMVFSINEPNCFVRSLEGSLKYSLVQS